MLRKIKLYGELAKFVGHKEFEVEVHSVGNAVSFLINNFPQLEPYMSPKYYQVKVGDYDIDETEIHHPIGEQDIHFVPAITGAGGNFGKILLGAGLIGLSFLSFGTSAGMGVAFSKGLAKVGLIQKGLFAIGASLVLSGVSDLLFPLPKDNGFDSEEDPKLSFSFSGLQNTSRAGTPIPIVYGEIMTGSVVISAAIDTNQVEG
tara:strand:- start:379 stop:987 length:609 start_codon:yes stop_codon:yes gene_type:complete